MTENKVQCIAILKVANGYITIPMKLSVTGNMEQPLKIDQICVFRDFLDLMNYVKADLT